VSPLVLAEDTIEDVRYVRLGGFVQSPMGGAIEVAPPAIGDEMGANIENDTGRPA
jgi:hypothetical protein